MMKRNFLLGALGALGALLSLPVAASELSCPDMAALVQVNGCPTEEELQYTYTGYCSDDSMAYSGKTDPCVRYADYRKLKNVALWESADGHFDGYVSCDLPEAQWRKLRPTGIELAMKGKIARIVCTYPQGIALTHRTRENCTVADAQACAANPAACRATCN